MTQTSAFIAFHGKPDIKAQCLARLEADLAADPKSWDTWRNSDELGLPEWLCRLAEARWWPRGWSRDFLQALPVGGDLDAIKGPFLVFVLSCARGVVEANQTDVLAAVDRSISLWKRSDIASGEWLDQANAAEAAANAARTRPSWRAALAAAAAAKAAERPQAVVETMEHAFAAGSRAAEATRDRLLPFHYGTFSDELLRLMKTSRDRPHPSS